MNPGFARRLSAAVTAWAHGRQPLPGALCDETREQSAMGRYEPRKPDDGPADRSAEIARLREENRALRYRLARPDRTPLLEHQLAVVTADRDRLELVNDRLRARLREYEAPTADTAVMPRRRSLPAPGRRP